MWAGAPGLRAASWLPISASRAGEFIAPQGSSSLATPSAEAARAASIATCGIAAASSQSCTRRPSASTSRQRHRPVKTLSWIRKRRSPATWIETSPSPSTSLVTASAAASIPSISTRGPCRSRSGSQRSSWARKRASTSRDPASAASSTFSGTRGISKVFMPRGIAMKSSSTSSSGCDPGPRARTGMGNSFIVSPCIGHEAQPLAAASAPRTGIPTVGGRVGGAASNARNCSRYGSQSRRPSIAPT